jgi:hypothetical protein
MKIPLNRFVAFAKPYLNIAGASVAVWLVAKANVLGIPGLGAHQNEIATGLAGAGVALVTWGATQIGDLKWLRGHHIELEALAGPTATDTHAAVEEGEVDTPAEDVPLSGLPSDEEELRSPPPPAEATLRGSSDEIPEP